MNLGNIIMFIKHYFYLFDTEPFLNNGQWNMKGWEQFQETVIQTEKELTEGEDK